MSKVRASNLKIYISKEKAETLEGAPTDLLSLECAVTNFNWDFGSAEEEDVTPLCEAEARHTEYSLRGKGTISFGMFFDTEGEARKALETSNADLAKRYIKVEYLNDEKTVFLTREVLGTVESLNETVETGGFVRIEVSIGTSGKVKSTDGKVGE